ncbi:MAG: translocation/assembly module TamB domain-containing protein [Steroidobacteraceae bacterium]
MKTKTRWLLILSLLVILFTGAGAAWFLTSGAGLARAVAMLESLEIVRIRISGAQGRLIGPLRADVIVIEHARATIRITGFEADFEPSAIMAGRISAERVREATVAIQVHDRTGPPTPPVFMSRWLTLAIDDFAVSELRITSLHGADLRLRGLAGSATITRSQIRFRDGATEADNWAVAGASGRLLARDPIAIEGGAAWSLLAERELIGVAQLSGDLDRLQVRAQVAAPGKGTADILLTHLTGVLRWEGTAEIEQLDLNQWFDPAPLGPLNGSFKGHGDRSNYTAAGTIHGKGLPTSGVTAAGTAGFADDVVTVSELVLAVPGATNVRIHGAIHFGEKPAYAMQAEWTDLGWPLVGPEAIRSSTGMLNAEGWREFGYRLTGVFRRQDAPPVEGRAVGRVTATQLIVEESTLHTLGGRIEAQGMLTRDSHRAWTISGRAHAVNPATLRKDLPGRLSFAYAASGSGLDKDANWTVAVTDLSGKFRGQDVSGRGIVRRQNAHMQFERVALAVGSARLRLDGALGRDQSLDGRLIADDLSDFLPELGGHIDATLQVRGSSVNLAFTGHDLAWNEDKATVLSADARIDLEDRQSSWLRLRTAGLRIAGQTLTDTRLSLDGFMRDHRIKFRVGAGEDAVELQGRGSYLNQRYKLETESIVATGPRTPPYQLETPTRLLASADMVELAPACLVAGARRVCVEGRWQRNANWSLQAHTQSFPLEALIVKVPGRPHYRGLLFVEARVSGEAGQPWLADIQAEIRDAVFQYQTVSGKDQSIALGRTLLTLQSDVDRHRLNLRLADAVGADLTAELVAERRADAKFTELPISGKVRGATRRLDLLPLFFDDIDHASGSLTVDFAVSGRVATPLLAGQVQLADGTLDFYQANLRLRGIQATLALQQTGLGLNATATAGSGTLDLDGRLNWQDRRINGVLTMKGTRLLLVDVPEARILASPDLRFALDDRHIDVTGSVTIPEARITPAETAGAVLVSTDERILRPDEQADEGASFEVASDLRLLLGKRVNLDAYGLKGSISGAVRARSAPHEAATASGELEIEKGRYRAYTRELDVERGRLLFTGGPVTDPGVDLRASRKLPGYTVGVIVRGRLRQPQLTLYSEPPLSQTQIASMLIIGRTLDSFQDAEAGSLAAQSPSLATQGSAMLAGQLGRYVGLDEAGVAQDANARSALVLGKFLSPRLYVSYGISLVDEINTIKLRYTIGDRWVVSTETGSESAIDLEYSIEH